MSERRRGAKAAIAVALLLGAVAPASAAPTVTYPCKTTPEFRQLDFWVGEWDVTDPGGRLVGHSSIQLIVGDCIVYENWSGARGHVGKSFNFWDAANKRWQQTWVDDSGGVQQYWGKLERGAMRARRERRADALRRDRRRWRAAASSG